MSKLIFSLFSEFSMNVTKVKLTPNKEEVKMPAEEGILLYCNSEK